MSSLQRRKAVSQFMTWLTAFCAVLAVGALFIILGFILFDGLSKLNLSFFINSPKPVGEPGSGIANAIVGSLIMIGLGTLFGMPVGVLAGLYLAEFGNNRFGVILRF
ncbi:MAG: phosphate ABC transporter permease PtsA, partial [Blastocatellia bacterium]|nr:phosphate ABC transporter permease PtsA [Blastocatellia bacterium]